MTIFDDYESWKNENLDLISSLIKNKSKMIVRFSPVIAVVDYLNNENKFRTISEDEELIFSTGFDYIYDQFHLISTLLELKFNNDLNEMEKYSQTINLLLYINEFQAEVLNLDEDYKSNINLLDDLEEAVTEYIDKKENAPNEYFLVLDDITNKIFEQNNIEVQTVDQIFYEIALEYQIYSDEDDEDVFNTVISNKINSKK